MLAEAAESVAEQAAQIASGGDIERFALAAGLLLLAIGTIFAEAFFPSFGALTLVALGFLVASLVVAFSMGAAWGVLLLAIAAVLLPVSMWFALKLLRKTSLVLSPTGEGESTADEKSPASAPPLKARGVALTTLRPSGTALIGGKRYSVVTTGDLVEQDAQIEVMSVDGTHIMVKPVNA